MPLLQSDETIAPDQIETILGILDGQELQSVPRDEPEPYMTLKQIGEKLNLSACTQWRWQVPGHNLGGRKRFRLGEVEAYLHSDEFKKKAEELKQERRKG